MSWYGSYILDMYCICGYFFRWFDFRDFPSLIARKISTSIYCNESIREIVKLSPRNILHLVQNRRNICIPKLWHIQYTYTWILICTSGNWTEAYQFSLYFMMPFCAVCLALLYHNWWVYWRRTRCMILLLFLLAYSLLSLNLEFLSLLSSSHSIFSLFSCGIFLLFSLFFTQLSLKK